MSRFPRILNIGSGKNFREDCLNLDVSSCWRPDIVADLEEPFPRDPDQVFETRRFGPIRLPPGSFEEILADDVLEHIRDLPTAMKSCLDLLQPGGIFRINVPYDLSTGAWSDPGHVRAFNERSWVYFTDWFWYFGWTEHRFHLKKLLFNTNEFGDSLRERGASLEEVVRTPRAVDSMSVELCKVPLSEEDRTNPTFFMDRPLPG